MYFFPYILSGGRESLLLPYPRLWTEHTAIWSGRPGALVISPSFTGHIEIVRLQQFGFRQEHKTLRTITSHISFRSKDYLDWETMNKLCEQNNDFETFIDDVQRDYAGKKIHPSEYENIINDPDTFIKKMRSGKLLLN